ncbi:MAG: hypothetical protein ACM3US_06085 [Sphingomonadaceae bacterium]
MRFRKPLAILGLAGLVATLAVAGSAFAQTPTPDQQAASSNYREHFLDRLANALGTTREKLNSAFTQARNETVDQMVKDGKLTQEQADKIKAKSDTAPFAFGFRGFGKRHEGGIVFKGGGQVHVAIAEALGMTPEELTNQLKSGKSLAELAQGKEQAVKDAVVGIVKAQLDNAVKNGKMTQERADRILEQIRTADLSKLGGRGFMGKGWFKGNGMGKQAPRDNSSRGPAALRMPAL